MYKLLKKSIDQNLNKTALTCLNKSINYGELDEYIDRTAQLLTAIGAAKDSVITICLPNIHSAAIAFYAANKLGLDINMVHPLLPPKEIVNTMNKTGSKIIFIMSVSYPACSELFSSVGIKAIVTSPTDLHSGIVRTIYALRNRKVLSKVPKSLPHFRDVFKLSRTSLPQNNSLLESRIFVHSGGTSGMPKTIELSNSAINNLALRTPHMLSCGKADVSRLKMLMVLPMFHGFGLCMCLHNMLILGGETIMIPKFNPRNTLKTVLKHKANIIIGVPTLYDKLFRELDPKKHDLSFITNLFCGGDTLTDNMRKKLNNLLPPCGCKTTLMEGYGLTESVTVNCVNTLLCNKDGSVGKPIPDIDVRIIDESKCPVGAEVQGEIIVSGNTLMTGYYLDDAATKDIFIEISGKKYLRTGDWGYIDKDGFVHFIQRMGRIFKRNGMKIFPSQIEDTIMASGLTLACAVTMKDDILQAYVTPVNGGSGISEAILLHCRTNLPHWSVPKQIFLRDHLPMTIMNKIDYKNLK